LNRVVLARIAPLAAAPLLLTGCSAAADSPDDSGAASGGPIVLGASLSLTGGLAQFGLALQAGYQQLVTDVNATGGITVAGGRRQVTLVVLDNRSDPKAVNAQIGELALKEHPVGLLGGCTSPIVVPGALAAQQQRIPFVSTCDPVEGFSAGNPNGWQTSWDLFFDEIQQAQLVGSSLSKVHSNKKLAVFTDTEPDGVVERGLLTKQASAAGLDVVGDYSFPVGTTDFSSFITDAKAKGAELVAAQMIPPDGIALWKQMKAMNFAPKGTFVAKAATGISWPNALGPVAEGTMLAGYWTAGTGKANSAHLMKTLGVKFARREADLGISVMGYTAANVLTDAIADAGSTDPNEIGLAIGLTKKDYPLGRISFDPITHTAITPLLLEQWQGGTLVPIGAGHSGARLQDPAQGLLTEGAR
jgi:branched-chain amino acid transport system substrate-binding protein